MGTHRRVSNHLFVFILVAFTSAAQVKLSVAAPQKEDFSSTILPRDLLSDSLKHQLTGYVALDIEKEAGFSVTRADYQILDQIVTAAKKAVDGYEIKDKRHSIRLLSKLARIIDTYKKEERVNAGDGRFSVALREGAFDCDVLVILYLTIAEATGLPLSPLLAPQHILLSWDDGSRHFLWETTTARETRERDLRDTFSIDEDAILQGYYLRSLSRSEMKGVLYYTRARSHFLSGKIDRARHDLDITFSLFPELIPAVHLRGLLYQDLGDHRAAIASFSKALEMDTHLFDALYARGISNLRMYHYEAAEADFEDVIAMDPSAADAYHGRGLVRYAQGRLKEAQTDFDRSLAIDPALAEAYLARGVIWSDLQKNERAIQDFSKAIELKPDLAIAYELRGEVNWVLGHYIDAASDYKTSQMLKYPEELKSPHVLIHAGVDNQRLSEVAGGKDEEVYRENN